MADCMKGATLYIKTEQNVEVLSPRVTIGDVTKLYSTNSELVKQVSNIVLYHIKSKEDSKYMFSIMKVIELITKEHPDIEIVNLGEQDFIVDYKLPKNQKKYFEYFKAFLVAVSVFFGSAFTIMTFNMDVSVQDLFNIVYELVLGTGKTESSVLEISYAVGLPVGIIIFFNHFSRLKLHNDPTPIQTQMRLYEEDVNKTLIEDASREGKTIDSN